MKTTETDDSVFSNEVSSALQRAEPEIQNFVREFQTWNAKLEKRVAKLEVENISYKNRIAALEKENAEYAERFRNVDISRERSNALFDGIQQLHDDLVKQAHGNRPEEA